jgi:phage-related holin
MSTLKAIAISLVAIFAPIKAMLATTLVLIVADLILGIIAAHKRGEAITSAGLRRSVTKIFVYEVAIMLGFLAETYLIGSVPIVRLIGGLISVVEVASILENLNSISGTNLLKSVVQKLGSQNQEPPK